MAHFWKYQWKVIRRGTNDLGKNINKLFAAYSLPEIGLMKLATLFFLVATLVSYINSDQNDFIKSIGQTGQTAAIFTFICLVAWLIQVFIASAKIDKEQEDEIALLKTRIKTKRTSLHNFKKLRKLYDDGTLLVTRAAKDDLISSCIRQ